MGFNNLGAQALADRLAAAGVARGNRRSASRWASRSARPRSSRWPRRPRTTSRSLRILAPYADYLAVNVSSPNTPGLRSLQDADTLGELIKILVAEAWRLADPGPTRCRSWSSSPRI